MKLSIIVPAYNEEKTIILMIEKLLILDFGLNTNVEVIVINDGSKDKTLSLLNSYAKNNDTIKILDNSKNIGKSRTVQRGIIESKGDYIIIQDADLEYDPNDILRLIAHCVKNNLDFVYGNRFNGSNKLIYKSFFIGNKVVSLVSNIFTYLKLKKIIPDMEVCYKLIKGDIARDIASKLTATSNFGFEPEVTARLANYKINGKHLKFDILPISYFPRTIEQGKKIRWKDGFKAIGEIIKYNLAK